MEQHVKDHCSDISPSFFKRHSFQFHWPPGMTPAPHEKALETSVDGFSIFKTDGNLERTIITFAFCLSDFVQGVAWHGKAHGQE
jgi:hypothetical protein